MMIIQFNSLGVITSVDTSNASFRQGSKGEVIQAVFAGKSNSTHTAKINFTRPDGTAVQNLVMSPDPNNQSAFLFELDDLWFLAISGNATMTIFLYNASNVIQAQGQATIPIESSDYIDEDDAPITTEQYDNLMALLSNKANNSSVIIVVDDITDLDMTQFGTNQLFYDRVTDAYYIKTNSSPYYQLADTNGLPGANKGSIARYQYDPTNETKTVSQMYSLQNTRTFILNISGVEYIYQIKTSGSAYSVSAFNILEKAFYYLDGMVGNARIESILTNTYRYRLADLDHDLDLGTHELRFTYNGQVARVFMGSDNNLYLVTSAGDIILNPDGIAEYADSEIANKNYVDTQDATKLDKVTTTSATALRLYAVSNAGVQQMLNVGENALDIPQRKFNKQINVPLIPSSPDDATSKSYVDSRVSALGSALIYIGTRTVAQINALTGMSIGDVYNVSDSGTLTQGDVQVNEGDNVAWDGSKWDKLSSDIDLSAYYNKNETDELLDEKQDTLVSGTNIKSINNQSLLGSGDITIQAGAIEKTGAELEDMTYVEGQLYYCTSASESFSADTLYMATGENTIVRFTQTSVNTNPAITSFSVSPTTTELGNVRNCTYSYTLKKYSAISNVALDGTIISATPSSASGSGTSAVAHDSHTFTLTATYSGGTLSRTATISPLYRQFYGVVSGDTVAQVLANLKDVQTDTSSLKTLLQNSLPSSVSLSLGSTPVYVYFIVRSNLAINTLKSGGFDVPFSLVDTQSFTNHYDASYTVRVYRTDNKVFGDMVVNINS